MRSSANAEARGACGPARFLELLGPMAAVQQGADHWVGSDRRRRNRGKADTYRTAPIVRTSASACRASEPKSSSLSASIHWS